MNFSTNKKIYLVLILWFLFLGILIKFGFIPFLGQLKIFSQKLIEQKKTQNLLELRIKDFEEFSRDYLSYQTILNKIKNSFVAEPEVPIEFIKFLETEAEKTKIKLKISPLNVKSEKDDPWPPIGFQVFWAESFPNFLRSLERLEQGPWLIEIFQLRIGRISEKFILPEMDFGGLNPGDVHSVINLKVFSLKQ